MTEPTKARPNFRIPDFVAATKGEQPHHARSFVVLGLIAALSLSTVTFTLRAAQAELKDLSINGGVQDGKARLIIEAQLSGLSGDKAPPLFASTLQQVIRIEPEKLTEEIHATLDILQGDPKELTFTITGDGEITRIAGGDLQDWSIRQETNGTRTLVLRPRPKEKRPQLNVTLTAEFHRRQWRNPLRPLTLTPAHPALANGYVKVVFDPELDVQPLNPSGLVPIENKFLPEAIRPAPDASDPEPLAFRFHGTAYSLPLNVTPAHPDARRVVLRDFRLRGRLSDTSAAFTLTATARVKNPRGASVVLLSGNVALTEMAPHPDWRIQFDQGRFLLVFEKPGEFPLRLQFNAAVRRSEGWNRLDFRVAPSSLQPVIIEGLDPETRFEFAGAARPERRGSEFISFLPPDGTMKLAWKEAAAETEGRLFYSAQMLSQISISPGLMRQQTLLEGRVMQGELSRIVLRLHGEGSVTRVQGPAVLAWEILPDPRSAERRLLVQFNQPQKDAFTLQLQTQTELGAFPLAVNAMRIQPEGATRFAGHVRVVNEGAVRLEVLESTGLSQISPDQFPESDATKPLFVTQASQRFAFRFSSADISLRVQADNVLPEVGVSQVLTYRLGETELAIEAELELDIREAPVREVLLRVPRAFVVARLNASGLADYFSTDNPGEPDTELRLVYGQPMTGRHLIQLRLERNAPFADPSWALPRIEVTRAKSVRGHLAVAADPGWRLSPERTQGLTEIATAYFPRRLGGIQSAFRISEAAWQATLRVERLPQSIQADVFHLFSIGEGMGYGSSTINYLISGAPLGTFRLELSEEYFNVEFTGREVRNWQKTTNGYVVQLHTPVAGPHTLLATYERPFKSQGETLTFTGARPLDAQTEQGHTIVVSANQFKVTPVNVSPGLLSLEPAEVPSEYRLFSDAPILAAYRYSSRPFNLQLSLSPLTQGDTLSLAVDRAIFNTRISKSGEIVTDARLFVKNRGNPHFPLTLPEGTELWSVTVNGATTVPVRDGAINLIPLAQRADPNSIQTLDLKLASRSQIPGRVVAAAPVVHAPVLLAEWRLEPDTGQRLEFRRGSLAPASGELDPSGFAGMMRLFRGAAGWDAAVQFLSVLILLGLGVIAWRWAINDGAWRWGLRHLGGTLVGFASLGLALAVLILLIDKARSQSQAVPRGLTFLAPVQQSGSALTVEVNNVRDEFAIGRAAGKAWPAILALLVWGYGLIRGRGWIRPLAILAGWTLMAWAALRWPNGAPLFFQLLILFFVVHVIWPALRRLWNAPRKPLPVGNAPAASAATALLMTALLGLGLKTVGAESGTEPASNSSLREGRELAGVDSSAAQAPFRPLPGVEVRREGLAESVAQNIRVEGNFALAAAKIRWLATKNQLLPLVGEPAVVTSIDYPTNALTLVQAVVNSKRVLQLRAIQDGEFEIEVRYQLQIIRKAGESGFILPTRHGLVNRLVLTLADLDAEVFSPGAVSIEQAAGAPVEGTGSGSTYNVVLAPVHEPWIGWKPRSRDARREKPVFFAEIVQLFIPTAGVVEGAHHAQIRPAQGELSELIFDVPGGATITDVIDPARAGPPVDAKNAKAPGTSNSFISVWRFDPDARKLRVSLNPPQSRPFTLVVRSQVATGPLPFEQPVGLLSVTNAVTQLGLVGVATGNDVQLDNVAATTLSPINLEDFPAPALADLKAQFPGLTLRRAFRYADVKGTLLVKASAVEPDVRIETQETLSLGEDRTVLAAKLIASVTRAGIFRLSFALPGGLDVESISGEALSHWTELPAAEGRLITLHLKTRTEGQQQFAISLAGPGIKATNGYVVPRLTVREAGKQQGQLVIVPEQGLRLQVAQRESATQLDPQKAGIQQKGVLAFRLLQSSWSLTLDLERIDAWVQVTSLQHVTIDDAQVRLAANLFYQIENTGLRALRVRVPTNAANVRFRGEQMADFLPVPGTVTNDLQTWEVKFHRRMLGRYLLQLTCQMPLATGTTNAVVPGIQAMDVNLQRGFVTLQSAGRLQIKVDAAPAALQPTEWQSIPRGLQQDLPSTTASHAFRLVEPSYVLPLTLERHQAVRLLPARVNATTLTSVVSDDGVMLTQVRLDLVPGDKRLLKLILPAEARFWFAFVNEGGVWPWREGPEALLIPLEQQSRTDTPVTVELFYSSRIGRPGHGKLDLQLLGPKFDLPLENISWNVFLNEKWRLDDWKGTLQLEGQSVTSAPAAVDLQTYLQNEAAQKRDKTRQAETLLSLGNTLLERGDPAQARRAFQSAYGLSAHDSAFNEDARVQLHNLKLQQALLGLNVRQSAVAGEGAAATSGPIAGKLDELRNRKEVSYTQQEARQILESNTAEQNDALMRVAERLVQQQDAAVTPPAGVRASIPQQGRMLTFKRSVQVDPSGDLRIAIEASSARTASAAAKLLILAGVFMALGLLTWAARGLRPPPRAA